MPDDHGPALPFLLLAIFGPAWILAPDSVVADPRGVSADQEAVGNQDQAAGSTSENNGFDITCHALGPEQATISASITVLL